jgi:hypothetical protein
MFADLGAVHEQGHGAVAVIHFAAAGSARLHGTHVDRQLGPGHVSTSQHRLHLRCRVAVIQMKHSECLTRPGHVKHVEAVGDGDITDERQLALDWPLRQDRNRNGNRIHFRDAMWCLVCCAEEPELDGELAFRKIVTDFSVHGPFDALQKVDVVPAAVGIDGDDPQIYSLIYGNGDCTAGKKHILLVRGPE